MTSPEIGDPTLIGGFPKSGTTLVAALLDGHPDLLSFPEETWTLKVASRVPRAEWFEHVLTSEPVRRLAGGRVETPGGVRDYRGFDFARFESEARRLHDASDRSARAVLESLLTAFAGVTDAGPKLRWSEKSPEQERHVARHAADWDGLRLVLVVRDPRAVLCSFRRKRERSDQHIFADGLIERWRAGIRDALEQEERRPGSVVIVRYEDVVVRPRAAMERVLAALELPWDDAVLEPTLFGRPWHGNSMYGGAMQGVSEAPAERWRTEIDEHEHALIEGCLTRELRALGYPVDAARGFLRSSLAVVPRQHAGVLSRARAIRRLRRLRDEPPAPVDGAAFARATGAA